MATPPTWVSFGASVYNTTTTPKTVSITVLTGDVIVVMSVIENSDLAPVTTAPTGGSLTYTQVAALGTDGTHGRIMAWTATATTGATFSVSAVKPATATSTVWGVMVWVYRGSAGFGAVGAPAVGTTSNSVTLTTTGANSALVIGSNDWNSIDGTTRTRRTLNASTGSEESYFRDVATYAVYAQRYDDTGAAGSVTGGYSAPTGQASAVVAVEILGSGAAPTTTPILVMATRR